MGTSDFTSLETEPVGTPVSPEQAPADRFKHLPPAIPLAATVAVVGTVPQIPLGPEGAAGGGDGD